MPSDSAGPCLASGERERRTGDENLAVRTTPGSAHRSTKPFVALAVLFARARWRVVWSVERYLGSAWHRSDRRAAPNFPSEPQAEAGVSFRCAVPNILDSLLERVPDGALREALLSEIRRLRDTTDFGLVFERLDRASGIRTKHGVRYRRIVAVIKDANDDLLSLDLKNEDAGRNSLKRRTRPTSDPPSPPTEARTEWGATPPSSVHRGGSPGGAGSRDGWRLLEDSESERPLARRCNARGAKSSASPVSALESADKTGTIRAMAQMERRLISQRTREAMAQLRALGACLGRPRSVPQSVRVRIRDLHARGESFNAIAQRLTREGVPTGQGGSRWRHNVVANIAREG